MALLPAPTLSTHPLPGTLLPLSGPPRPPLDGPPRVDLRGPLQLGGPILETTLPNGSRQTSPMPTWAFHQPIRTLEKSLPTTFTGLTFMRESMDVVQSLVSTPLTVPQYQLTRVLACHHFGHHWTFSPGPVDRVQGALSSQPARKEDHGLWHCLGTASGYIDHKRFGGQFSDRLCLRDSSC